MSGTETIRVRNLRKSFGSNVVLDSVDLTVHKGEVVTILGRSGGGKSTLLRCLNLLETPDSGTIEVAEHKVFADNRPADKRHLVALRRSIGMVFQSFHLFPHLTAVENVALPLMHVRGHSEDQALAESIELLDRVGLIDRCLIRPAQLSGGQQQRVAIARALALKPEALLFDEPTSALDPESTVEVLDVMKKLSADGMTMVVVTHELAFAMGVADRIVLMDTGRVIENGSPQDVLQSTDPRTVSFLSSHAAGAY
ncbi:amino acid ABC transporter ATP-binding protein [Arthrobacter sp. D2-10]